MTQNRQNKHDTTKTIPEYYIIEAVSTKKVNLPYSITWCIGFFAQPIFLTGTYCIHTDVLMAASDNQ